ncbi:MAG: hypothetical protein ACOYOB_19980 [Myxococcota bacterium]
MPVTPLPYIRTVTIPYVGGAAALDTKVEDSEQYAYFMIQFVGFTAGTTFNLYGSCDGANYGILDSTSNGLPSAPHATAAVAGLLVNLQPEVVMKGGIKIKQTAVSAGSGTIVVAMSGNAYRAARGV